MADGEVIDADQLSWTAPRRKALAVLAAAAGAVRISNVTTHHENRGEPSIAGAPAAWLTDRGLICDDPEESERRGAGYCRLTDFGRRVATREAGVNQ